MSGWICFCLSQGPEFDEEEESEFTVTELKERARKQREELEKRMMGDGSDDEGDKDGEDGEQDGGSRKTTNDNSGCSWGMGEWRMLDSCSMLNTVAVTLSDSVSLRVNREFRSILFFSLYNPRWQLKKPFQTRMRMRKTRFQQSSMRTRKLPT